MENPHTFAQIAGWAIFAVFGVAFALTVFFGTLFTVQQQTKRIVTRFGKFVRVAGAGLNFKWPIIDGVSDSISLRVKQLELSELTYTDKGTSITITANVQYQVDENDGSVKLAFYKLQNPEGQIKSHVSSSIRAKVPTMSLEKVQNSQAEIASHVKGELQATMKDFGYIITDVLITRAEPDATVVKANNEKYASQQAKETAQNLAEAAYTRKVKEAEGDKEAAIIRGQGLAGERSAVIAGLQTSVREFEEGVPGTTAKDAMVLLAFQQLADAYVKMAQGSGAKVIFVPSGAGASNQMLDELRNAFIAGNEASSDTPAEPKQ
jgi:regulator of protease activity HflC (stomatin/prohibitin superfamily)